MKDNYFNKPGGPLGVPDPDAIFKNCEAPRPGPCPPEPKYDCPPYCEPPGWCGPVPPPPQPGPPPNHCAPCPPEKPTSPWDYLKAVNWKLDNAMRMWGSAMDEVTGTLKKVKEAAIDNSAYYDNRSVWTEGGYNEADNVQYIVTHIKPKDCAGRPIRMGLHLAYDDPTNNKLQQSAFEASEFELADKMFTAIPVTGSGWFGRNFWRGAPIPTDESKSNLYTVGFTKAGRMRWYPNTTTTERMRQDGIQNAMGVYGILVDKGNITDPALRINIPTAQLKNARIGMGQKECGEIIIVSVPGEQEVNGMTTDNLAATMLAYGCVTAVEISQGTDSASLDKGGLLVEPSNEIVPECYAYWFISRKCEIKNKVSFDLAWLAQKYGQIWWTVRLHEKRLGNIDKKIEDIEAELASHAADIYDLKTRMAVVEAAIVRIDGELDAIRTELVTLWDALNQEIADRIAGDSALQAQIDALEIRMTDAEATLAYHEARIVALRADTDRNTADIAQHRIEIDALQALAADHEQKLADLRTDVDANSAKIAEHESAIVDINAKIAAHEVRITALESKVAENEAELARQQAEIDTLKTLTADLRTDVDALKLIATDLQSQLAAQNAQIVNILSSITSIETALDGLKTRWDELDGRITALEECCEESRADITIIKTDLENAITVNNTQNDRLDALEAGGGGGGWDEKRVKAIEDVNDIQDDRLDALEAIPPGQLWFDIKPPDQGDNRLTRFALMWDVGASNWVIWHCMLARTGDVLALSVNVEFTSAIAMTQAKAIPLALGAGFGGGAFTPDIVPYDPFGINVSGLWWTLNLTSDGTSGLFYRLYTYPGALVSMTEVENLSFVDLNEWASGVGIPSAVRGSDPGNVTEFTYVQAVEDQVML